MLFVWCVRVYIRGVGASLFGIMDASHTVRDEWHGLMVILEPGFLFQTRLGLGVRRGPAHV